jgi:16S rRNA (uracil1498-N3)-methyltransferase
MAGLRAYHPFSVPENASELCLSAGESAHLVRSLRARAGESLEAFDGAGRIWRGAVLRPDSAALLMRIAAFENRPPRQPRLALAQALPKGGLMDDIVRAAVELDVSEIHPLYSAHCEVKLDASRAAARVERWRAIAIEACKQSGNPWLPRVFSPEPLSRWLSKEGQTFLPRQFATSSQSPIRPATLAFVGSLESGAVPLAQLGIGQLTDTATLERLLILIGPEGDFSPEEYALIRGSGISGVRFGPHVLRVPTAAHYALTALDQLRQRTNS